MINCTSGYTMPFVPVFWTAACPFQPPAGVTRSGKELGLSRNTVLTVYEQLLAEGYAFSRQGSGTFVAETVPDSCLSTASQPIAVDGEQRRAELSQRGITLLQHASASPKQWGAFIPGVPDVNAFPHHIFSKLQARISRRPTSQRLTYSNQGGSPELRHALVDYLRVSRSVRCSPEQILITEGIHQAIESGHPHAV